MASPQGIQAPSTETNRIWESQGSPRLSVVMIGHRRADLLSRAITSLEEHCRSGGWELVLIVNGGSAEVRAFAGGLLARAAFPLSVVTIPECRPGAARNHGVKRARAPVLLFLDDDIECFQDVAAAAIELFQNPALQAAGGANLTPPDSGALERATGGMMASFLGAASMRRRYRLGAEGSADEHGLILCNLAVRSREFTLERGFAAHMISNEENVLLQRLGSRGARLWASPRLAVYHRRRDTWSGLCSQAAKYGAGRAQNLLLVPETLSALYFLPLLFALYLLLVPSLASGSLGAAALLPAAVYFGLVGLHSLLLCCLRRDPAHLLGPAVFPAVHLSYAYGFARGFLAWGPRRKKLREHSA